MIIVNTTFYVHESIDNQFRRWVNDTYLPSALDKGLNDPSVSRLLIDAQENMTGYAVQIKAKDIEKAMNWHDNEGAGLRGQMNGIHGEKILFFTTYMEQIIS